MSTEEVRGQINKVQNEMTSLSSTTVRYGEGVVITEHFLQQVSLLLSKYGTLVGNAKATYPEYLEEIDQIDEIIRGYLEYLMKSRQSDHCFKLVNLAVGKISEFVSFVERLKAIPPKEKVSRVAYEKAVRENETLRKTIEIMVKYKGLPELNDLLETARNSGLSTDENWVLALCSVNLIESVVNKKLDDLGESTKGNFESRYERLRKVIKEKEQRDIQQLLPIALYKVIRNKLDHASHVNRVTPEEAKDICKIVVSLMAELHG